MDKENLNVEVFEHENAMCRELYKKQGGCAWGKCESCGVPLLLEKLKTGNIYDNSEEVDKIRARFFNSEI